MMIRWWTRNNILLLAALSCWLPRLASAGPPVHPPATRAVQTSTAAVGTNDRILTMITTNTTLVCRAFRRLGQPFLEQGALGRFAMDRIDDHADE